MAAIFNAEYIIASNPPSWKPLEKNRAFYGKRMKLGTHLQLYSMPNQVNLAIVPSQITPGAVVAAIFQNGRNLRN